MLCVAFGGMCMPTAILTVKRKAPVQLFTLQAGPSRQAGTPTCACNHCLGLLLPPQARPALLLGHQLQQFVLQQAKRDAQGRPQRCPKH